MRRPVPLLLLCCVAFAASAAPADAAATRAEYVAQVDPICHSTSKPLKNAGRSINKSLKIFLKDVNDPSAGKHQRIRAVNRFIGQTTRFLTKVNRIFGGMVDRIALVAAAPGDETTVAQWIATLRQYLDLNERANRALKHHQSRKSIVLSDKALAALDQADGLVESFGFKYCP